jgi:hypothetical protein
MKANKKIQGKINTNGEWMSRRRHHQTTTKQTRNINNESVTWQHRCGSLINFTKVVQWRTWPLRIKTNHDKRKHVKHKLTRWRRARSRRIIISFNNFVNLQHKSQILTWSRRSSSHKTCYAHIAARFSWYSTARINGYTQKKPLVHKKISKTHRRMKF